MEELLPNATVRFIYPSDEFETFTTIQPLASALKINALLGNMDRWEIDGEEKPPYDLIDEDVYVVLELQAIGKMEIVSDNSEDCIIQDKPGLFSTGTVIIGSIDDILSEGLFKIIIKGFSIPVFVCCRSGRWRYEEVNACRGEKVKVEGVMDCFFNFPISEIYA